MSNNHQNKVVLQINNLEALERLIGGESQIEMDIRNTIVQKFTEKHLKGLLHSDMLVPIRRAIDQANDNIENHIKQEVNKQVGNIDRDWSGNIRSTSLSPEFRNAVDSAIKNLVAKMVQDEVARILPTLNTIITTTVNKCVTAEINTRVRDEIRNKLKEVIGC